VGLGQMGFGMAVRLHKQRYKVVAFDIAQSSRRRFEAVGGMIANSAVDAAKGNEVFISMVANADQTNSVLFGECDNGAVHGMFYEGKHA
jgi:3-hydroxyisobutyrate dehydrogenase-like beta-hydroxyacid dehydrogenase